MPKAKEKAEAGGRPPSQHHSVPDRGVSTEKEAEFDKLHNKLCFRLESERPTVERVDLVPERPDYLVLYRNLFSAQECEAIVQIIDSVGLNQASKADLHPKKGEAYLDRENATFEHPRLANIVWDRLQAAGLPEVDGRPPKGLFQKLRYYCYRKGQRFDQHVDTYVRDSEADQSEYTLLIYLNTSTDAPAQPREDPDSATSLPALSGGNTVFYATAKKVLASVAPEAGAALIHAHGRRCLMHAGAAVNKGTKYVLRSDIIYHKGQS